MDAGIARTARLSTLVHPGLLVAAWLAGARRVARCRPRRAAVGRWPASARWLVLGAGWRSLSALGGLGARRPTSACWLAVAAGALLCSRKLVVLVLTGHWSSPLAAVLGGAGRCSASAAGCAATSAAASIDVVRDAARSLEFAQPWWLLLLLLIPVVVWLELPQPRRARAGAAVGRHRPALPAHRCS